jgi:hypothetical protein
VKRLIAFFAAGLLFSSIFARGQGALRGGGHQKRFSGD